MKKTTLTAAALVAAACKKQKAAESTAAPSTNAKTASGAATQTGPRASARVARYTGSFGSNAARPTANGSPEPVEVPAEVVAELNSVAAERIESAFLGRKLVGDPDVEVRFGGPEPNDGLLVTIVVDGRAASRAIPPATNDPEQVTNLDHTVERLLDELAISRTGGAL